MLQIEDHCVGCPPNMGCLGRGCSYKDVPVYYCDNCSDYAKYNMGEYDLCSECADEYLNDIWNQYTIEEKAELLDVDIYERYS